MAARPAAARGRGGHGVQRPRRPTRTGGSTPGCCASIRSRASSRCRAASGRSAGTCPSRGGDARDRLGQRDRVLARTARTMYASDYAHAHVLAWDVNDDGGCQAGGCSPRPPAGSCDGLAVDGEGGVLVALGEGGIARFDPDGSLGGRSRCRPTSSRACASAARTCATCTSPRSRAGGGALLRGRAGRSGPRRSTPASCCRPPENAVTRLRRMARKGLAAALKDRTRYEPAEVEPRVLERGWRRATSTPSRRARRTRTTRSRSRRPTSPGRCTWATRSTPRSRTSWSASTACSGRRTKWIFGTDHAGIATQAQVEKQLAPRARAGRSSAARTFERRVWEWREQYGRTIVEQFQRLGASCDYADERFTLDEGYVARGREGLRGPLRQGADLPRQLHGQLGSGHALGDLRPRGRGPRGHRHALLHRLSVRGRRAARSRSRPCGRRRCSRTPRSP